MGKEKRSGRKKRFVQREAGSDVDEQLIAHFNGTYVGDIGLRSATGSALERAAFGLGAGTTVSDGFDNNVRLGVLGPAGRIDAGKVSRALASLCGPAPLPILTVGAGKKKKPLPEKEQKRRIQEAKRVAKEWPYYYPVLRGYYTQPNHGPFAGLIHYFDEYAGVVPIIPRAESIVKEWCRTQLHHDLDRTTELVLHSETEHKKKLGELEEKAANSKKPSKLLLAQIEVMKAPIRKPDVTVSVRIKWEICDQWSLSALKAVAVASNGSKDTPARQEARVVMHELLYQAEKLWRAARNAYARERREINNSLRPKKQEEEELKKFKPKLGPMIPADED